jgi:hypothetical protein
VNTAETGLPVSLSLRDFSVLQKLLTSLLEEYLKGPVPSPIDLHDAPSEITDSNLRWLMVLDLCASPEVLRQGVQERSPDDGSLVVLMRYFLSRGRPLDLDRFDWVLTYIFRRRFEKEGPEATENIGAQITEMFPDFQQPPLTPDATAIIQRISMALGEIKAFSSFAALTKSGLIAKGRDWKERFEGERHHPAVLAVVVNYNLALGRAFRDLFNRAALDSRELVNRLATADYRGNVEHMNRVTESTGSGRRRPELTGQTPIIRGPVQDPVKALGLDESRESQKLRFAFRSLVSHCENSENRAHNVLRLSNLQLHLAEWETRALSTDYPGTDLSFRAEFARSIGQVVAFLYRIEEERGLFNRNASTEYLWKPHYDALIWLYARGKEYVQKLNGFTLDIAKRGLPEKQEQIQKSATRLAEALERLAAFLKEAR